MGQTDNQHLGGTLIADVQVHPFFQRDPADGLGLDFLELTQKVSFDRIGVHQCLKEQAFPFSKAEHSIELERIAFWH